MARSFSSPLLISSLSFYRGNAHNVAVPPSFLGFNFLFLFYASWGMFVIAMWVQSRFLRKKEKRLQLIYDAVIFAGVVFFTAATAASLISQARFFIRRYSIFSHKTLSEKQEYLFDDLYRFPYRIRQDFPGRYRAELITDIDMTQDPGMFMNRALAYFLYPIDIRGIRFPEPVQALIMVQKMNAEDFIPDGFSIAAQYSDEYFIAFKENVDEDFFLAE